MSSVPVCCICCEQFTVDSVVQSIRCGHIFHGDCIKRWLTSCSTCPKCRQRSGILQRIYLSFETEKKKDEPNLAAQKKIENLLSQLLLEKSKRSVAELKNKENEEECEKLMALNRNLRTALTAEKQKCCTAVESKLRLKKELDILKEALEEKEAKKPSHHCVHVHCSIHMLPATSHSCRRICKKHLYCP